MGKSPKLGLGQGISSMSLEHLMAPESKEVLTKPTLLGGGGGVVQGHRSQWEEPKLAHSAPQNK